MIKDKIKETVGEAIKNKKDFKLNGKEYLYGKLHKNCFGYEQLDNNGIVDLQEIIDNLNTKTEEKNES